MLFVGNLPCFDTILIFIAIVYHSILYICIMNTNKMCTLQNRSKYLMQPQNARARFSFNFRVKHDSYFIMSSYADPKFSNANVFLRLILHKYM